MALDQARLISTAREHEERGKLSKAIGVYQKLLKAEPGNLRFQLRVGDLQLRNDSAPQARESFLKVARAYEEQGLALKAIAVYNQIVQIDPEDAELRIALATTYQRLGLLNDAANQYGNAIGLLEASGEHVRKLHTIRAMLELDPGNSAIRLRLAEEFSARGMVDEAADEFQVVCDQLRESGNTADFVVVAERLLFHRPDDVEISVALARYHLANKHPQRALPRLHFAYKSRSRDQEVLRLLADAFDQLGQGHKAAVILKQLILLLEGAGLMSEAQEVRDRMSGMLPRDPDGLRKSRPAPVVIEDEFRDLVIQKGEESSAPVAAPPPPPPNAPRGVDEVEVPLDLEEPSEDRTREEMWEDVTLDGIDAPVLEEDPIQDLALISGDQEETDATLSELPMVPAESEMILSAPPIPREVEAESSPLNSAEIDALIAGELEEVEFFVEQGLMNEALSILEELASNHPDHVAIGERLRGLKSGETAS